MNSTIATDTLFSIFHFLEGHTITLNDIINYGTQFDSASILPNNLGFINEEWDDEEQDHEAIKLLPKKSNNCKIN